jgi:hypothetical protein
MLHETDFQTARRQGARARLVRLRWRYIHGAALLAMAFTCRPAQASMFHGETLDAISDVLSWAVLVIVPVVGIAVFWLVHILPEKIAEKKHHPQAKAIQTLCLLSLVFGGVLWPLAWIWAYSRPVLYKMAYGTDVDHSHGAPADTHAITPEEENRKLREQVAQLQAQLEPKGGRA